MTKGLKAASYRSLSARNAPEPGNVTKQEAGSLFPSIEDFLWFQLSLVRSGGRPADGGSPAVQHPSGHSAEHYTLEALQQYLLQYPASHYSRQG